VLLFISSVKLKDFIEGAQSPRKLPSFIKHEVTVVTFMREL